MLGHMVEVFGVLQHNAGVLAAAFQHDLLEVALRRITQKSPPGLRRAGEAHHIHAHMPPQRLPHRRSVARQHLQHPARHARLRRQFRHAQSGQRRLLSGFHNDRAARGQGRPDLPCQHQHRKIPRKHSGYDADRLTHDHRQSIIAGRTHLIIKLIRGLCVPLDAMDRLGDVDQLAVADRFARIQRFHHRQLPPVAGDQFAQPDQHVLARRRVQPRPMALIKRLARLGHRQINISRRGRRDLHPGLARHRVHRCHHRARAAVVFAINKGRAGRVELSGNRPVFRLGQKLGHIWAPVI